MSAKKMKVHIIIRKLRKKSLQLCSVSWWQKLVPSQRVRGIKPSTSFLRVKLIITSQTFDLLAFIPHITTLQSKQKQQNCAYFEIIAQLGVSDFLIFLRQRIDHFRKINKQLNKQKINKAFSSCLHLLAISYKMQILVQQRQSDSSKVYLQLDNAFHLVNQMYQDLFEAFLKTCIYKFISITRKSKSMCVYALEQNIDSGKSNYNDQ